jgi:hypothetical protein
MATFQKRDDALRGYVSDIDVEQYGKVLIGLQAGYDKNVGELTKVDMQLKKIADTQLLNQEAKDYFFTRMRERKDVLEKNMGNFAHANELDYGMKTLYSAIDDTVATEIYNSSIPSTIQEQYKKIAEGKNPQLANSVNLEYSMKDIGTWLNTKGHLGKRFQGNSTYKPHVDLYKLAQDAAKAIDPTSYVNINKLTGGYEIYTEKGKEKNKTKIQQAIDVAINSNAAAKEQTKINGWANNRIYNDEEFFNNASGSLALWKKNISEDIDRNAAAIDGKKIGATDENTLRGIAEEVAYNRSLMARIGTYEAMVKSKNPQYRSEIESFFEIENLKNNTSNAFSYKSVTDKNLELNQYMAHKDDEAYRQSALQMQFDQNTFGNQMKMVEAIQKNNGGSATTQQLLAGGINPSIAASVGSNAGALDISTEGDNITKTSSREDAFEIGKTKQAEIAKIVSNDIVSLISLNNPQLKGNELSQEVKKYFDEDGSIREGQAAILIQEINDNYAKNVKGKKIDPSLSTTINNLRGNLSLYRQWKEANAEVESEISFTGGILNKAKDLALSAAGYIPYGAGIVNPMLLPMTNNASKVVSEYANQYRKGEYKNVINPYAKRGLIIDVGQTSVRLNDIIQTKELLKYSDDEDLRAIANMTDADFRDNLTKRFNKDAGSSGINTPTAIYDPSSPNDITVKVGDKTIKVEQSRIPQNSRAYGLIDTLKGEHSFSQKNLQESSTMLARLSDAINTSKSEPIDKTDASGVNHQFRVDLIGSSNIRLVYVSPSGEEVNIKMGAERSPIIPISQNMGDNQSVAYMITQSIESAMSEINSRVKK